LANKLLAYIDINTDDNYEESKKYNTLPENETGKTLPHKKDILKIAPSE